MRTHVILIDFENVQPKSLAPLLTQDHFRVVVFVGTNQTKLPFEFVATMQSLGSKAEYIKIAGAGSNALDFHIAFYIGLLASQNPTGCFHIISKDAGFDPLIEHLKTKKIDATRSASLTDLLIPNAKTKKPPLDNANLFIARLQNPKFPRPRTELALIRSLAASIGKKLTDLEISAVVSSLQTQGVLTIVDGKIIYASGAPSSPGPSKA